MAYGVQDFQQPNPLDFLIPQQPQVPQPQVPQQQAPQLQAPQQQGTGQQGGGQDEEALRTAAIKERVAEVQKAGELEDGRGGFNFRKLLEVVAPLLGAGVGALVGGSKGAEAGLAGGLGFTQGSQQRRQEKAQNRFEQQRTGLAGLRTQDQLLTNAVTRDAKRAELGAVRSQVEKDEHALFNRILKDDPNGALNLAEGSEFGSVKRLAGVARSMANLDKTVKADDVKGRWREALNKELESSGSLSEVGIRRLRSGFRKEIDAGVIDGRMLSDAEVELRESDSQIDVKGEEARKLVRDGNSIVGFLGEIHELLVLQNETAESLGPLTELGSVVEQTFGGEVDPRVAEIRAKLKLVTEIFARVQTGAAISETEIKNFNELVGNTNLTAKELELRMSVLSDSITSRMEETYRQSFEGGKTGFLQATPERQAELMAPLLPDTFTRQFADQETFKDSFPDFSGKTDEEVKASPQFKAWKKNRDARQ